MKPVLKAPGSMLLLKLRYDGPLSNFAFNHKLAPLHIVNALSSLFQSRSTHKRRLHAIQKLEGLKTKAGRSP